METRAILKLERKMPTPLQTTSGRPVEYVNRAGNKAWGLEWCNPDGSRNCMELMNLKCPLKVGDIKMHKGKNVRVVSVGMVLVNQDVEIPNDDVPATLTSWAWRCEIEDVE